jgi:hypothetical protein
MASVGERVSVDGSRGTVRYVGPVATSKTAGAIYAGIEWDDPARGRNDGCVVDGEGAATRYFTAAGPTAASFVKADLVARGRGFEDALRERYCDTSTGADGGALMGLSGKPVPVVLVGDDKVRAQQALCKLTHVVLREACVASVRGGDLAAVCPRVREVDLQGNLLGGWAEVAALGAQLPALRVLNLSDNRLPELGEAEAGALAGVFPALRTLILSGTGLGWASLQRLRALAPALEELHAAGNGIAALVPRPMRYDAAQGGGVAAPAGEGAGAGAAAGGGGGGDDEGGSLVPPAAFPALRALNLSGNPLSGWGQVHALRALPNLTRLMVNDCGLREVWVAAGAGAAGGGAPDFHALDTLSLSGSRLESPASVDAVDAFPALRALRLTNADLAFPGAPPLGPAEGRHVIIARCPRLTSLCGSEVRLREREEAEKSYARRAGMAWAEAEAAAAGRPVGEGGALTDVFGARSVGPQPEFNLLAPVSAAPTTLTVTAPEGFSKGADAGVITARGGDFAPGGAEAHASANPFIRAPVPLHAVSGGRAPHAYVPALDPWGLGAAAPEAAGRLQAHFPRFFLLAAKFDLLAPAKAAGGGGGTLAASTVSLTLRSMAGGSCMMDPVVRKLPLSTTVLAVKQLAAKLFKCSVELQRVSFREAADAYPSLLDDDGKPLSYYAVSTGGELLVEEVNPEGARAAGSSPPRFRGRDPRAARYPYPPRPRLTPPPSPPLPSTPPFPRGAPASRRGGRGEGGKGGGAGGAGRGHPPRARGLCVRAAPGRAERGRRRRRRRGVGERLQHFIDTVKKFRRALSLRSAL